jgi:hypothetical protein
VTASAISDFMPTPSTGILIIITLFSGISRQESGGGRRLICSQMPWNQYIFNRFMIFYQPDDFNEYTR